MSHLLHHLNPLADPAHDVYALVSALMPVQMEA
jgi:hypothetical protein